MTSKHPKRCSNHCVHETKYPFLYGWGCNAVRDDEGRPVNITAVEERLINEIGCALYSNHLELPDSCASHSSASEPVPEQMGDPWNCTDLGIECPDPEQEWCSWPCDKWLLCHDASIATKARADVLDAIERFTFTCMWFNATDCPGASNGECICDDCERFGYSSPEGVRNYIKFLRQQEGKP